ncbi:MAG: viroplasmin family protein [Coprococcus sp.]
MMGRKCKYGKEKYYAVKVGAKLGIYETWAECEVQIKGFSGAQYKSFSNLSDAEIYITGEGDVETQTDRIENGNTVEQINTEVEEELKKFRTK